MEMDKRGGLEGRWDLRGLKIEFLRVGGMGCVIWGGMNEVVTRIGGFFFYGFFGFGIFFLVLVIV